MSSSTPERRDRPLFTLPLEPSAKERSGAAASAFHARRVWESRAIEGTRKREEDAPAPVLGESLGDAQGGEGLARAAGHDELAAVRGFQAADDGVQRLPLVGSQVLLAGADRLLRLVKGEAVPVDGGAASRPLGPQPHLVEERGVRGARPRPSRFGRIRPEPRRAGRVG